MAVADAVLVQRTLSGDLEGFGELHRRYYRRVVHVILGIVKDRVQAEDTVQDAYMSALKDLPRLVDPDRFYPWLCRIAVNRAIDEKRRFARRERLSGDWGDSAGGKEVQAPSTEPSVLDALMKNEQSQVVRGAIERLPDRQQAAVVLRFFDGLSMRSIAEVLGCEEVTARTQVFRGLRRLGILLKARSKTPNE